MASPRRPSHRRHQPRERGPGPERFRPRPRSRFDARRSRFMKSVPSVRRLLRAALVAALLLAGAAPALAQGKNSGVYLTEAFHRVTDNAALAARAKGFGYNDGICILGAWVDAGQQVNFDLPLNA